MEIERCSKDNYPIITLVDQSKVCAAEYLDQHVGNCKVTDICFINTERVMFAIEFENGALLPILCHDCNGAKVFEDCGNAHCPKCEEGTVATNNYSKELVGYSLVAFRLIDSKAVGFMLEFNKKGKTFKLSTALKSIRMLYIPGE